MDHIVSTPAPRVECHSPDQTAQHLIQPGLVFLQGWGVHNSSGQPVPVPHCPLSKNFFLKSNLNLYSFTLKRFPLSYNYQTV